MGKASRIASLSAFYPLIFMGLVELAMSLGLIVPSFEDILLKSVGVGIKIVLDRDVLFKVKPRCRGDINNSGYRDRDFVVARTGAKRIIVLGDSFAMGLNVGPGETFPKRLEAALGKGYEVYNMGVHGYGPDQSLIQLKKEALKFNPDFVVLSVFTNDFNDIFKNRLFAVGLKGELLRTEKNAVTSAIPRLNSLLLLDFLRYKYSPKKSYLRDLFILLFRDSYDRDLWGGSPVKYELMGAIIKDMKKTVEESGARFLVVIIPSPNDIADAMAGGAKGKRLFTNERIMADICMAAAVPHISLYPIFLEQKDPSSFYGGEDRHLSLRGNLLVAETMAKRISSARP